LLADQVRAGAGAPVLAQLLAAQERFHWYCRQAQYRLSLVPRQAAERGSGRPESQPEDQLKQFREKNRRALEGPGLEKVRAQVKAHAREWERRPTPAPDPVPDAVPGRSVEPLALDLPERGIPTYWQTDKRGGPLRLTLTRAERRQVRQAMAGSTLVAVLLLAAWCLPFVPLLVPVLHRTWPEQIVLLGWLAWQVLGLPLPGLALMGLGIAGRLYLLVRWGLALLHRAAPTAVAAPGGAQAASS
jgi:hypothetical protein